VFFIAYCFTYFVELFIGSLFQFRINCDKQVFGVCIGFFSLVVCTCVYTLAFILNEWQWALGRSWKVFVPFFFKWPIFDGVVCHSHTWFEDGRILSLNFSFLKGHLYLFWMNKYIFKRPSLRE
jgi:hypothetical protein